MSSFTIDGEIARIEMNGATVICDAEWFQSPTIYTHSVAGELRFIPSAYSWSLHKMNFSHRYAKTMLTRRIEGLRKKFTLKMHRIVMNAKPGESVDHINGDTFDNRRCNLRIATTQQNNCNLRNRITERSPYRGVFWREDFHKWVAKIRVNRKGHYLGSYKTAEEAGRAYDAAALHYHGPFASLNFPQPELIGAAQ